MKIKYPATCVVHWATGPVECCDEHARQLIGLGNMLGSHVVATKLSGKAECSNCVNEAKSAPSQEGDLEAQEK